MLALTILLGAGIAAADDDELEQAKALFANGVELVAAEDFPSALAAFEKSYENAPRPTTLFNIGMCQKGMFLYVEARATFERYLVDTAEEGETELRQKARSANEELDQLVGRLLVTGAPDGAEIQVDGKRAGITPLGWPIDVNPGVHAVRVEKDGHQSFETSVTVGSATEAEVAAEMPEIEQQSQAPVDEYSALLAKAEAAKLSKHERAKKLEAEWIKVARIAFEESLGHEERALVLDHFLDTYPTKNPHKQMAKLYIEALEEGEEPADVLDPECMRTKTEWVALRIGGSNYGGNGVLSVVTLRWELFAWDILRFSGGGGALIANDKERRWSLSGGTGVAIPWHFVDDGRFEIRFGLGLMVGRVNVEEDLLGLILVPEGVLIWHVLEHLALQAGIHLDLATFDFQGETSFPTPALGASIGLRI
jgi:tetratricopeptide (TPR) repeat protein